MIRSIIISRLYNLPPNLNEEIGAAAELEKFKAIQRLQDDWAEGFNRFDGPGEAFYAAEINDHLVGVCGLNRDPYVDDASVARLRRLYVLPRFRRMGIGRQLVLRARQDATKHFGRLRLRTLNPNSAAFFESIGFIRVNGLEAVTHEMRICPESETR